ncbi:MAG: glycosyltransferase family 2 protein [Xanthomonadales bacterium]|nr:glycosyltransferase family 2 protein [Xanthomonadales bacterium]
MTIEIRTEGTVAGPEPEPEPTVSVVIPAYAAGDWLDACLRGLNRSDWRHYEVLVVDDASPSRDMESRAEAHGASYLRLDRNSGPAVARNTGVAHTTGDFIMTVDADVVVHPDTMRLGAQALASDPTLAAVFGSYDESPGHPAFLSQYRNLYHRWVHQQSDPEASTFWSGCGMVRRDAFEAVHGFGTGFDRPSIEDIEFGYRIRDAGWRIRLCKDMLCTHLKDWKLVDMVRTDIMRRGVPWMALLLERGKDESTLNTNPRAKIATAAAGLMCGALILAFWAPLLLIVAGLLAALIVTLQWGFYRYVARLKGVTFAVRVAPAQVLFFVCCAVAVPLGYWRYWRSR